MPYIIYYPSMIVAEKQILTPDEINECHQLFNNPKLYSQQEILSKAVRIRKVLCLPIEQKYEQEIHIIINSNLYVSIYNYMTSLIQQIKEQFKNINAPNKNESVNHEVLTLGQCLWIFTNLCLGDSDTVNKIVSLGILRVTEQTLTMLVYPSIVECTLQLIGNLLGEKNHQIKLYYLQSLTFAHFLKENFLHIWSYKNGCDQHITWALANAFRELYKMIPSDNPLVQQLLQFYLPILATYLQFPKSNENSDMNIYWTLTYMTVEWDYYYAQISMLINKRFQNSSSKIKTIMVQIYGNMVANSQVGVKLAIEHELILPFILNTLKNKNPDKFQEKFMKTCGWILSNILAGTQEQIDFLLNNYSTFFNEIYEILEINTKYSIIKQLTWAICNMLQCCSMEAFQMLYSSNILVILAQKVSLILIEYNDQRLAEVYLEGIENYISKHSQFPQKFRLQISQKLEILKTLSEVKDYFNKEAKTIRALSAIAYLESIIAVEEIAMIHIK